MERKRGWADHWEHWIILYIAIALSAVAIAWTLATRNVSVSACEQANDIRSTISMMVQQSQENLVNLDRRLFNIERDAWDELVEERLVQLNKTLELMAPLNCSALWLPWGGIEKQDQDKE